VVAVFINQKKAGFHPQRRCPLFQQVAFLLQKVAFFVIQPGLVTDPDIWPIEEVLPIE